jgi:hypothetical protein
VRFTLGVLILGGLGCGSSGSHDSPGPGVAGNLSGGSASQVGSGGGGVGGSGLAAGASVGGSSQVPDLPAECRPEPAAITSPGSNPWLEFIPTWVETICSNIGGCCDAATFDVEGCRRHYSGMTSVLANGDPDHYAYDPAAAEVCLEEVRSDLGACNNGFGASCTRVMRGLLRDGEPCTNHRDCVSGGCSGAGSGQKCGRPHAALDAPCALSCSLDNYGAWSCWGQPSQADIGQCFLEDGLFCSLNGKALGPLDGSGATCQRLRAAGESCAGASECADRFCTSGVCGPDPGAEVGADCPCKASLHCVEGTCQPGGAFGEACDFANSPCAAGLTCTAGTCQCGGYYSSYIMPIICSYE